MTKKISNQFLCSRMMLPEHKESINSYKKKTEYKKKYRIPSFDEQQCEEFQFLINKSLNKKIKLKVTVLEKKYQEYIGIVTNTYPESGLIKIKTNKEFKKITADKIVNIEECST
jgi:hypothetical protein